MQERALYVDINLSELIEEVVVHPNAGLAFNSIKTVARKRTQGLGIAFIDLQLKDKNGIRTAHPHSKVKYNWCSRPEIY